MTCTTNRATSFVYNSLLLTLSAILMRALAVAFNVYVSNRVGAEVMGLYTLMSSVWGFALTLASSGINLASTRCVAEALGRGSEIRAIMRRCILYSLFFGVISMLLLLLLATPLSTHWLSDERACKPLMLMAFSLPAISVSTALSGFFTGVRRVWKNAFTQVATQAIKIYATALLLTQMLHLGAEYSCIAIVLGGVISEVISLLINIVLYSLERKWLSTDHQASFEKRGLFPKIISIAMPVALSTYVRSGLSSVEHILIPIGLEIYGASSSQALEEYGMLVGMALPVALFPYALIHSFTGLLVPDISESISRGEKNHLRYTTNRVLRLTIAFGLCTAGVLSVCASKFGIVLYSNPNVGKFIYYLAPLVPLMFVDTVTDSLLKGIGEQVYTMNVNIADAAISVILVSILVPRLGAFGYIAVLYISEIINFALSAVKLLERSNFKFRIFKWLFVPLCMIIVSTLICKAVFSMSLFLSLPPIITLISEGVFCSAIFLLLLCFSGSIDREMRMWIVGTIFPKNKEKKRCRQN